MLTSPGPPPNDESGHQSGPKPREAAGLNRCFWGGAGGQPTRPNKKRLFPWTPCVRETTFFTPGFGGDSCSPPARNPEGRHQVSPFRRPQNRTLKARAAGHIASLKRSGFWSGEAKTALRRLWVEEAEALTAQEFEVAWLGAGRYSGVPSDTRG